MMRLGLCIIFAGWAGLVSAQQVSPPNDAGTSTGAVVNILTIDVDELFTQSQFGTRILGDYRYGRENFAAENRLIAAGLREEELALAAQRSAMTDEAFRREAEAFDEKAQAIRRSQDAKERELEAILTDGRDRFLEVSRPILEELMLSRGASAVLDRRSVLLSLGSVDITTVAIEQIDAAIGDGTASLQADPRSGNATDN